MSTETPVILSAVRTPIGKFQGGLAGFSAPELGGKAVAEAIRRAGLDANQIDEAILGNVVQAGLGQNPARQAALKGGCAPRVAAMTINKVCGSGLKAVALAAQAVQLGESEIAVAGGMESMSNCPYLLPQARNMGSLARSRTSSQSRATRKRFARASPVSLKHKFCRLKSHRKKANPSSLNMTSRRARTPQLRLSRS